MTTGRSSSSKNHFNSLSDVISSTKNFVALDGFGIVSFRTGSGVSRIVVSPTVLSDWYFKAVVDFNGVKPIVGVIVVNDSETDAHRTRHSAE